MQPGSPHEGVVAAATIDESALQSMVTVEIAQHSRTLGLDISSAALFQHTNREFQRRVEEHCHEAIVKRDCSLLEVLATQADALRAFETAATHGLLSSLVPLGWRTLGRIGALQAFADGLDSTRPQRTHELLQRVLRRSLAQYANSQPSDSKFGSLSYRTPSELALPAAQKLVAESDVQQLREGKAVIVDAQLEPLSGPCISAVRDHLVKHIEKMAVPSTAPCNHGALSMQLSLPQEDATDPRSYMNVCHSSPETAALLRLLAAIPAEVERHGWPRKLRVPPLVTLGCYTASSGASYTPHLDRWPNEELNRRELTILCYVNPGWDPKRSGGCLRLHPADDAADGVSNRDAPTAPVDVEPLPGRIVIFPSGTVKHQVLPCTEGERLALTLWVEHC